MPARSLLTMRFFDSVSPQSLVMFAKHMSVLLKSGITVGQALTIVTQQVESSNLTWRLKEVSKRVQAGTSLTESLQAFPDVFTPFFLGMIQVGEQSGKLSESMDFLADQLGKSYSLKKKIQGALLYPIVVFSATFGLAMFISLFVLPQLTDFFTKLEIELPLSTRILVAFAEFSRDFGVVAAVSLFASIFLFTTVVQLEPFKTYWHYTVLRIPFFGKLIRYGQMAFVSRNLGTLLKSGLPISQAVDITQTTLSNVVYRRDMSLILRSVQQGKSIAQSFKQVSSHRFLPLLTSMVGMGEQSGSVDEMFLYISNFFESEIDNTAKNLSTILEPVLLIAVGLIVGFVAYAIITPIYQLTGSIGA